MKEGKMKENMNISKSDFLLYLEAPMHLWAMKHDQYEKVPSEFELNLMKQGLEVEPVAREFVEKFILNINNDEKLLFQETFSNDKFYARVDLLIYKPNTDTYDLYEVKSGSSVKKDNRYDVTFQSILLSEFVKLDRIYVVHMNKEYVRSGDLDLGQLFDVDDETDWVQDHLKEVDSLRNSAYKIAFLDSPVTIERCDKPKECPCLPLCHPDLPEFSIYDIPNLRGQKQALLNMGIMDVNDVPSTFPLSDKQMKIVENAKSGQEFVDRDGIIEVIRGFEYPLYFLDYETYGSAIPLFNGYKPHQHVLFQYSLHIMNEIGGEVDHKECLITSTDEPSRQLLNSLIQDIGLEGTVFVWNKTFEVTKNKEMAMLYPEFEDFLLDVNERVFDLGDFVNYGYYLHPGFRGSWSIKNVLPIVVPELSYEGMEISKGDEAMVAWKKIVFEETDDAVIQQTKDNLLRYCELDTLAMVEIFRFLVKKVG